jgi:hypothetical protein
MEDTVALMLFIALVFGAVLCYLLWEVRKLRKELASREPPNLCDDRLGLWLYCLDHKLKELDRKL